ncbi:cyclin-O [Chanos chanos]|uniref:Cyclin-O n=1 Tax=Chanos chanos TaxID=29144 RepID=A0A6J2WLU8_CHACN|nr:cyclin-O [Chanos chanos]
MSVLSDSGFEEDIQSLSPSPPPLLHWSTVPQDRLVADRQDFQEYDESCFVIQLHNEETFLASDCLARQPQVTAEARCKLVSWLIAVHRHFKLSFESCCLAVNIMDRFLVTTSVAADCFQLLGVTSLLIATKQVEVCSPRIKQLLSLCCNTFSREQLCNLECLILLRLNFRLAAPTHAFFLDYYSSRSTAQWVTPAGADGRKTADGTGDCLNGRRCDWDHRSIEAEACKSLARRICELSLADYAFNRYAPSVTAQCAVRLATDILRSQSNEPSPTGLTDSLQTSCDQSQTQEQKQNNALNYIDNLPPEGDSHHLIQQCMESLRLLVSLNYEAMQSLTAL